jgi:hypothetical protein
MQPFLLIQQRYCSIFWELFLVFISQESCVHWVPFCNLVHVLFIMDFVNFQCIFLSKWCTTCNFQCIFLVHAIYLISLFCGWFLTSFYFHSQDLKKKERELQAMEAELNKRERVCALDFLFFSLFLCILCSVVYNLPLLPFALEQYIQSNNELYFFMAKAFHSRQYVLQDHAALLLYTWFMLLTKALLLLLVLNDCSWERHCFAFVLCWF